MKIEGYPGKKNALIGKLATMVGRQPVYNGAPEFSYDIGDYRVFRDGSMAVLDDDADPGILDVLISSGLLVDPLRGGTAQPAAVQTPAEDLPITEDSPAEERAAEETLEAPAENPQTGTADPHWYYSVLQPRSMGDYSKPIVIMDRVVTAQTVINLLNMIYSKGDLLSRIVARSRAFWADEKFIYNINYEKPKSIERIQRLSKKSDQSRLVEGIEFTQNSVTFTGFPRTKDAALRAAYEKLAEYMYRHASTVQWVSSKQTAIDSEKYAARTWINHLGMRGAENKLYRDMLLRELSGSAAFRTRDQELARQAKRDEKSRQMRNQRRRQLLALRRAD